MRERDEEEHELSATWCNAEQTAAAGADPKCAVGCGGSRQQRPSQEDALGHHTAIASAPQPIETGVTTISAKKERAISPGDTGGRRCVG